MVGWQPTRSQPVGAAHWSTHRDSGRSERTGDYVWQAGGIKGGYAGHVPRDQIEVGKSHFLCVRGDEPQRNHHRQQTPRHSARESSGEARSSTPGYGGHRPGDRDLAGRSYWTHCNSNAPANYGVRNATPRSRPQRRVASPEDGNRWVVSSSAYGSSFIEPGVVPTPNPEPTGLWVSPEQFRNPDAVALKPEHVRQIVKPMSGYASVWVPPAGLYIENSKKGLGINMWELRDGKKEPVEDEWVQPPAVRDPEKNALRVKHVRQMTKPLQGSKSTWVPPAGAPP